MLMGIMPVGATDLEEIPPSVGRRGRGSGGSPADAGLGGLTVRELITIVRGGVDPSSTLLHKSMTCVPCGNASLIFAFFGLRV